jgi:putative chitinase
MLKADDLKMIMPRLPADKLAIYASALAMAMEESQITRVTRAAAFLAQLAHESGDLRFWEEKLTYSAEKLVQLWPKRYTPQLAAQHAGKPEMIANHVYASRFGNGDTASGDGWRYRGRGPIQITFKDNYRACGTAIGLDLVAKPELLAQPEAGFKSAVWYWMSRKLNEVADKPDFEATTKAINGGLNGQEHRLSYYHRALEVLGRSATLT